jgi:uncharacterized protein (UPF0210 family)
MADVCQKRERIRPTPKGGVDGVVSNCSDPSVESVTDHGRVRYQKKQDEQKPTAVVPMIGEEAGDKDGGSFEVEKLFGNIILFSIVVVRFQRLRRRVGRIKTSST